MRTATRRSSLAALATSLALTQPACLAVSARAHVGGVVDERGAGVQAGVALGIGIATSKRSAIMGTPGVVTGAPTLGLLDTIEYVSLPGDDSPLAWRAGFGGVAGLIGAPSLIGAHLATVFLVRDRGRSWAGHEKMGGGGSSRSSWGLGIESRIGISVRDGNAAAGPDRGLGGSVMLTGEWISLSRWTCC